MTNAVTLASIANSGYARNRIINGDMAVDQRNNGSSVSTGGTVIYTLDRWYVGSNGAATTIQRVAGATANQYRMQVTGAASVTNITVSQRIEAVNCADLASQTVTLSFDTSNSLLTSLTWSASYANSTDSFGTLTSPTVTAITSGSVTISSTVTRYSVSFAVPSAATTGLVIQFTVGAQTSGTWLLGNVQLEIGTQATPYEWRDHGLEMLMCQRYFQKFSVFPVTSVGYAISYYGGTAVAFPVQRLSVKMRSTPSASLENSSVQYYSYSGVWTNTTLTVNVLSDEMYSIGANSDGDGRGKLFRNGSSGTAPNPHVLFSAEL
jgi:hypothetical protein